MNLEYVTINGIELATKLAAKDTHDYFFERFHEYYLIYEADSSVRYTDEAQKYFDRKYEYYLNKIKDFRIK